MATGVELATAWIRLVPTLDGAQGAIAKQLDPAAEKAGSDAGDKAGKKFSTGMKLAITAGSAVLVKGIVDVFNTGLEELKFGEKISAQTDQLIKNTGVATSTDRIEKYTLALSKLSGVSEEDLQSAGNSVLKFGDISADNLQRATVSINDMAAAGKDAAGTGEMLGKALADPAKAATILKRSGVLLNEEQKAMIASFTEAGDKAGAQGVILDALEGTYGGMAEAAGDTLGGKLNKLNNAWENVAGVMVEAVIPALGWITDVIGGLLAFLEESPGVVQALAIALGVMTTAIVAANVAMWAMALNPIVAIILGIIVAVGLLVGAIWWVATETTFFQDLWQGAMDVIGAVVTWVWEKVLEPVFKAIGDVFNWLWTYIIKPIVDLVVNYFRFWGAVVMWLYENAVKPALKFIGDIFNWLWVNVIKPVIDWITNALNLLGLGFRILYDQYVKPVMDGISAVLSTVWTWIDQNVFTPFKAGIDLIGKAFENTAKAIGTAWEGIKKAAAVPINFILDTVWNNGLRSFWNGMVDGLGLKDMKLPEAKLVKFANGSEDHRAQIARGGEMRLWAEPETGGEAYIPLAKSKRARSSAILATVAQRFGYNLTQYASGGIFGGAIDNIVNPAAKGQNVFGRLPAAILGSAIKAAVDAIFGGGGGTVGGGNTLALVKSMLPSNLRISSVYRTPAENKAAGGAAGSLHMDKANPAVDITGSVGAMNSFALKLASVGKWRQLLYNNVSAPGIRAYPGHGNHIHVAADGGILPGLMKGGTVTKPGYTVVGERGPEILNLPEGAQVNPDYDELPSGSRFTFINHAPMGSTPSQELETFANRTEAFLP